MSSSLVGKFNHVYDIEQAKKENGNQASFIKFNMKAVELQSQELKKLRDYDSSSPEKSSQKIGKNRLL